MCFAGTLGNFRNFRWIYSIPQIKTKIIIVPSAGPLISNDGALELPSIEHDIDDRIVGGDGRKIEQHPYVVSLRADALHICSGSILTVTRVLSAAICWKPLSPLQNYTILAGSTSRTGDSTGQYRNVAAFITHPKYDPYRYENNIAVLYLDKPLVLGANVRSITLYLPSTQVPYGVNATIAGWGLTDLTDPTSWSNDLQATLIPISARDTCYAAYKGLINDSMLCAGLPKGGHGACLFDNGAPLTINGVQIGIFSWSSGCGAPNFPGVYTKVASFNDWLRLVLWTQKKLYVKYSTVLIK